MTGWIRLIHSQYCLGFIPVKFETYAYVNSKLMFQYFITQQKKYKKNNLLLVTSFVFGVTPA